ncbi:MAG: hypothetical protein ACTTKH_05165, partial [Treponema sp.]
MEVEKPKRQYKDSVLVDLLKNCNINMIDVYNSLNHTNLSEKTNIEYINIENSLYTTQRNDVACLIEGKIMV